MTEQPAPRVVIPVPAAGSLLQLLRDGRPRTRAELVSTTGLTRSTITQWMDTLLDKRLIAPTGEAASTGGRPPATFAFRPKARVALAADLGTSRARLAVTDMAGSLLAEDRADLPVSLGPEQVLNWVLERGLSLVKDAGAGTDHLLGLGLALPGQVEHATGDRAKALLPYGWDGFDVIGNLSDRLGRPVLMDKAVNTMAVGEHHLTWPDLSHLLFVRVDDGISCGIISDRRIFRGAYGAAGDLGHVRTPSAGDRPCGCGNTGCLETVASGRAIADSLSSGGVPAADTSDVVALVREGSTPAVRALRQAGRDIGETLSSAVNLINPSVIAVGGSLALAEGQLLAGIRQITYQRSLPLTTERLSIAPSKAGESASVTGAAVMVINHCLSFENAQALVVDA